MWEGRQANAIRGYYLKRKKKKEEMRSVTDLFLFHFAKKILLSSFSPRKETAAEYLNKPHSKANYSGNKANLDLKLMAFRQTSPGGIRFILI